MAKPAEQWITFDPDPAMRNREGMLLFTALITTIELFERLPPLRQPYTDMMDMKEMVNCPPIPLAEEQQIARGRIDALVKYRSA